MSDFTSSGYFYFFGCISRECGILFFASYLIGSIFVEVLIAPEVGAAAVASPARVLELDTHSSSKADPSKSSPPPVSVAPMVSPFLCLDDSKSNTEILERHVSPTPHEAMLTRWRSRVALRLSSPTTSILEIPTAPILPTPSATVTPSSEFPLAPVAMAAIMISFIYAMRALVLSYVDLCPPRNRFRDSISPEDSVEEDIDTDVLEDIKDDAIVVEGVVDRDVEARIDTGIDMEVDVGVDVEDEVKDDVESNDRVTMEIGVDMVDGIDIPDEIPLQMIKEIKMGEREVEVRSLIASVEIASLLDQVASLERSNARLQATKMMERSRADRFRRRVRFIESELRQIRRFRYYDRMRSKRLETFVNMTITRSAMNLVAVKELVSQRVEEALTAYKVTRAANALEAENHSQNSNDGDNGNEGNRNGENGMVKIEMLKLEMVLMEIQIRMIGVLGLLVESRFQELTMMCTEMVPEEEDQVEKFIGGLPDNIQGNGVITCFECGRQAQYRSDYLKLKEQNHGNKAKNKNGVGEARGKAYVLGERDANPDLNVIKDISYAIKLADKRVYETNTILRGCTLGLLGHPFNIDLMLVELGSFDVIIGMDRQGNPQMDLQDKGVIDSGCSRMENLVDNKVNVIRCDDRTEFNNKEMNKFFEIKEAANIACYVQNIVLVVKPHNKIPYELFHGRTPTLSFIRPFECLVTILNNLDHLGKFNGKADEGSGLDWLFDIDALTRTMNYKPIIIGTQSNGFVGTKASDNADNGFKPSSDDGKKVDEDLCKGNKCYDQEKEDNVNNTNDVNIVSPTINVVGTNGVNVAGELSFDPDMPALEDVGTFDFSNEDEDDDAVADMNNSDTIIQVSHILTTRIHKDHPLDQVIGDLHLSTQTRMMTHNFEEHRKIEEEVYACQPPGFEDLDFLDRLYKVEKSLYGLHQALRAWFTEVKNVSTPMENQKPLLKDEDGEEVDVHMYRSIIGSLMYLTSLRPDIMFTVCTRARYQVNPKVSHLDVVKKIFRHILTTAS
uniref:Reverse transcriptase Ty1/copia-type domain-containing protein n=1 Tax=Tanacetum cinerariifolium TaxID=118510 RepID=A0A699GK48_TANCI|nr:hypothetical protein [Tanacetum cinerariifolium]